MRAPTRVLRTAALLALLGVASSGCARFPAQLGVRPNEPDVKLLDVAGKGFCAEYVEYARYAQRLQEAYHSRSTQNRWWIYVAGITGIGVVAASGGLALGAAASVTTLGLLSISGGAAAAGFATLNNEALSQNYTSAANQIDQAMAEAEMLRLGTGNVTVGHFQLGDVMVSGGRVVDVVAGGQRIGDVPVGGIKLENVPAGPIILQWPVAGAGPADETACRFALLKLKGEVSRARKDLELARTSNAVGALQRAIRERDALNKLIQEAGPK